MNLDERKWVAERLKTILLPARHFWGINDKPNFTMYAVLVLMVGGGVVFPRLILYFFLNQNLSVQSMIINSLNWLSQRDINFFEFVTTYEIVFVKILMIILRILIIFVQWSMIRITSVWLKRDSNNFQFVTTDEIVSL